MYKMNPYFHIRVHCSSVWTGTIQELYDTEPKVFNSKQELVGLLDDYASRRMEVSEFTPLTNGSGHMEIKVITKHERKSLGCWVEIMHTQRDTWQGRFRYNGVVKCFKSGEELFSLINERYLRMQYLQVNSIENHSAKK